MPVRLFAAVLLLAAAGPAPAAGVVVLANRTNRDVTGTVAAAEGRPQRVTVARGDLTVLTVSGGTTVSFISDNRLQKSRVEENSAYAFTAAGNEVRLEPLYAGASPAGVPAKERTEGVVAPPRVTTLSVKLLVDKQEVDRDWENRLRKRLAAASEVLERQCRVRLEVIVVEQWDSRAEAQNFEEQLSDFERKVPARPAFLAIGFSSRRLPIDPKGGGRVSVLPVPLQTHILIGEWYPLSEIQRLEVLLHELGHLLGAVHTKETDSVMRMSPGDGRSAEKNFRIGYDPLNVLAMNLVARDAFRAAPLRKLGALDSGTRGQLTRLYKESARLNPDDAAPERYLQLLEDVAPPRPAQSADPLVGGARSVVAAVTSAADAAAELRLSGDRLTEHCIRAAASAAGKLPEGQRVPAFLLGLAVSLDTSVTLRKAATTRGLWGRVESDDERADRLKVVGQPTLHGRHAVARHFAVAAALTSIAGSTAAEPGGIVRELFDGGEAGGFNFAELLAELAGAALARALADSPDRLAAVAGSFTVDHYVPSPAGLEEAITHDEFARRYGSFSDERFRQRERELRRRIAELPAYKSK